MADNHDGPFAETTGANTNDVFDMEMESDAAFSVTTPANASKTDEDNTSTDPTFIRNQISIQRSASTAAAHASALSHKLSVRSNGSPEAATGPSISGVLHDNDEERVGRGRGRGNSTSSLIEATTSCSLVKSPSVSTNGSTKSMKSSKSVRSVHAVGSFPLGSLRVHSPSPTRAGSETRSFLKSGDVIIIRDIPPGSLIGYDTRGFAIKNKGDFEGIKAIPPGAHFLWGGSSAGSLRNGFWIMTSKKATDELGEIYVLRWDKEKEVLDEEFIAAEAMFQKEAIAEIFDKLQPYTIMIPNPATPKKLAGHATSSLAAKDPNIWHHLTSSMKGALLTKITGHQWNQWQVSSSHDFKPAFPTSIVPDDTNTPKVRDEVLRFVFPKTLIFWNTDTIGRDRTEQALDSSSHVLSVIHEKCTYEDSDEIVGELQFCYLTGMLLGNLACMEHWAHVVKILFQAFKLALDLPVFFRKVIEAVHTQFIYDEEGLDGSILDQDPNLPQDLKMILTIFKSRLNEQLMARGSNITPEQAAVGEVFEALESWLWKWGWDLRGNYVRSGQIQLEDGEFVDAELKDFQAEDERGEFAPVVVDIDENGRERGLIQF